MERLYEDTKFNYFFNDHIEENHEFYKFFQEILVQSIN